MWSKTVLGATLRRWVTLARAMPCANQENGKLVPEVESDGQGGLGLMHEANRFVHLACPDRP